jgi:hypothetical protein
MMKRKLKLSGPNDKTKKTCKHFGVKFSEYKSLSLLSGWTCPGAHVCKAKVVKCGDRLELLDYSTGFRCYAASQEVLYRQTYNQRLYNWNTIRSLNRESDIRDLLLRSIPEDTKLFRYHVGGDFFNIPYMHAAMLTARDRTDTVFYAYTKSLHHLSTCLKYFGPPPENFRISMSRGGIFDHMIPELKSKYGLAEVTVIDERPADSIARGLTIDYDDTHAVSALPGLSADFSLIIHGNQPKRGE